MKQLWRFVLTLVLLLGASPCAAQDASSQEEQRESQGTASAEQKLSPGQKYFTDVILVNQHGQKLRFYSDLLKDKVVVINTFFTSCQGSCPVTAGTFLKLQERLGDRLGRDVHLISVSVDPQTDTPARLKAYAERFKTRPGWHLVSGKKENVDWVLTKIGQHVETPQSHSNIIIIGNEPTGLWKKVFGLAQPEKIIQIVDGVLHNQG